MLKKNNILKFIPFILLSGCAHGMGDPPPPTYTFFLTSNTDELEVKKALLECGYSSPYYPFQYGVISINEIIKVNGCMEQSGYKHKSNGDRKTACLTFKKDNLPACKADAVIPSRSVSRRMNSPYCKQWKDKHLPVCQP